MYPNYMSDWVLPTVLLPVLVTHHFMFSGFNILQKGSSLCYPALYIIIQLRLSTILRVLVVMIVGVCFHRYPMTSYKSRLQTSVGHT